MSAETPVDTIWHILDDLWSMTAPILGPGKPLEPVMNFVL
jgi:hypothetical protein